MRYVPNLRPTVLAALVACLFVAGCGRAESGGGGGGGGGTSPGITDSEIKIGSSFPLSGPASAYAVISEGAKARFEAENAKGGVNGRKIKFTVLDDGYEPQRAVTNTKRLIEQDKVFGIFGSLGTANNLAVWDYMNQQKAPHVFLATGGVEFGQDPSKHPYTMGWQPDYISEGRAYAEYLKQTKEDATVAVLYQNDGFGKTVLKGFEEGIEGSGIKVTAKESYEATDPTVTSQMRKLSSSGADTFLDITTPKFGAQAIAAVAKSSWKPLHIVSNTSASKKLVFTPVGLDSAKGIISTAYYKDPESAQWANDAEMKEFRDGVKKYSKAAPDDNFAALGWAEAGTMIEALKQMKEPNRDSFMEAAKNMDAAVPLMLPGVKVQTSPDDYYPLQSMQIQQFDGKEWQLKGDVIDTSGDT
jgi:branched-chain amino acid transport system substrate-binding protein